MPYPLHHHQQRYAIIYRDIISNTELYVTCDVCCKNCFSTLSKAEFNCPSVAWQRSTSRLSCSKPLCDMTALSTSDVVDVFSTVTNHCLTPQDPSTPSHHTVLPSTPHQQTQPCALPSHISVTDSHTRQQLVKFTNSNR